MDYDGTCMNPDTHTPPEPVDGTPTPGIPTPTGVAMPIRVRVASAGEHQPDSSGQLPDTGLGRGPDPWPDRPYVEGRGWPVWIPPTSRSRYLSGSFALNLPTVPGEPHQGDWHKDEGWWSRSYLDGNDRYLEVPLAGNDPATCAPGLAQTRDIRPALAEADHPAGRQREPVWGATVPQAIVDLAWGSLHGRGQQPSRHDIFRWTSPEGFAATEKLAATIAKRIRDERIAAEWRTWQREAFEQPDAFYNETGTWRRFRQAMEERQAPFKIEIAVAGT